MSNVQMTDNSKKIVDGKNDVVERALLAIGAQCEGHAKTELSNTPKRIDTGLLRNSITYALDGEEANISSYRGHTGEHSGRPGGSGTYSGKAPKELPIRRCVWVGTNVEYATYVHNGTMKMAPNRFLRNAVVKHKREYKAIVQKFMQGH